MRSEDASAGVRAPGIKGNIALREGSRSAVKSPSAHQALELWTRQRRQDACVGSSRFDSVMLVVASFERSRRDGLSPLSARPPRGNVPSERSSEPKDKWSGSYAGAVRV